MRIDRRRRRHPDPDPDDDLLDPFDRAPAERRLQHRNDLMHDLRPGNHISASLVRSDPSPNNLPDPSRALHSPQNSPDPHSHHRTRIQRRSPDFSRGVSSGVGGLSAIRETRSRTFPGRLGHTLARSRADFPDPKRGRGGEETKRRKLGGHVAIYARVVGLEENKSTDGGGSWWGTDGRVAAASRCPRRSAMVGVPARVRGAPAPGRPRSRFGYTPFARQQNNDASAMISHGHTLTKKIC